MGIGAAVATALTVGGAFIASVGGTWVVRSWLERRQVLDAPNERSLHDKSIVTGGGIAVSLVVTALWLSLWVVGLAPPAAMLIPVTGLCAVGLVDDVSDLSWLSKLCLQIAVVLAFLAAYGSFSALDVFGVVLNNGSLTMVFSALWILGMVNIYNFMDGIDGLAGGYGALTACVAGLWFGTAGGLGMSLFMFGLMAACLGFLVWNWAPAKIFLGDAGSMMLGGVLAAAALVGQREHGMPVSAFVLLYAVFIADTTYTLFLRARRGEKIWRAHREHVYQRAVQSGMGHAAVTGVALGISAIICVLASLDVTRTGPRPLWPIFCLVILWITLVFVKKREKAGL